MSKFRNVFGAVLRGTVVVVHSVAAVLIPTKFADAATRDDGAHKDAVASDEGLRFQLDARADEALARSGRLMCRWLRTPAAHKDVVEDAVQVLAERGVDVGALLQAGALDEAVQTLIDTGAVEGSDDVGGDGVDIADVVEDLDVADIEEIVEGAADPACAWRNRTDVRNAHD